MTDAPAWTLERIAREQPALAPLAVLHALIEAALERLPGTLAAPAVVAAPGTLWLEGRPLLEAASGTLVAELPDVARAVAGAMASALPGAASALDEIVAGPALGTPAGWEAVAASFREPGWVPGGPHGPVARFVALRALSLPARRLARAWSPPHPDRWKRSRCPWCGVGAAASVARTGAGRTLLCVLCGGRWEIADASCTGCGERDASRITVLASRDAGPASLEACASCGTALKVFAVGDAPWGPPVALEVASVRLDLLAERDHSVFRDPVALAALYPPA